MQGEDRGGMYRRDFGAAMAGAGAALALTNKLHGAPTGRKELRTLFFNLSHENHEGHEYALLIGKARHVLQRATGSHPAVVRGRRRSRLINALPPNAITHVVENVQLPADAVQASYLQKDADTNTGMWGMTAIFLLPPKSSFHHAYQRARAVTADGPLPMSAKRRKYGLPPAMAFQDLLEEQDMVDFTDFATALINLHPEMLSAEPNSAAHIQANHIQPLQATQDVEEALTCAGTALPQGQSGTNPCSSSGVTSRISGPDNPTGWATLVPYTDEDGNPLKSASGNTKGLILYDAKWQPEIATPWISTAMAAASQRVKSDTTLGTDVTSGRSTLSDSDLTGRLWYTNDGVTSIDQSPTARRRARSSDNASFALSNITPSYNGYSLDATVTVSGTNATVTLTFKNWYLRWLGLYIQFYKSDGTVVSKDSLPGISVASGLDTANNELYLGTLTPEFTIYGIPVQASGNTVTFTFPTGAASSAKILASGLGLGSHTFQDTETVGIVMTSVFNMSLPMFLIFFGIGAQVDVCIKTVVIPYAVFLVTDIINTAIGGTIDQFITVFWRSLVRGLLNPTGPLQAFFEAFAKFIAAAEITEALEDSIPLVGAILQAVGALAALAEVTETSCEVVLSPKTYEYDLVATHDLPVTLLPPDKTGFPASAATYKVTAIFDNGTPRVQTLAMPGTTVQTLPLVQFTGVPLGGNVVVNVGFYTQDGTQVGHGSSGTIANNIDAAITITITEDRLPITTGTTYRHKQKTSLDAQGNHLWICAPAPAAPSTQSACQPNPGNLCSFRNITVSSLGYVGYGWQSYSSAPCPPGGPAQLDQLANISIANSSSGNAQANYAVTPCSLGGAARLVYDPLGRADLNFYVDTTQNVNALRQVNLSSPGFDPTSKTAWGVFNLPPTDLLLHPGGAVVTINSATSRMETLKLPDGPMTDDEAAVSLLATLHGGQGTRPGLFDTPTVSAITSEGVVLILESGNNRIHAVDLAGNPVRLFSKQPEAYFLNFTQTGGASTQYLDLAVEFSGFIYVLSFNNPVYRLDIYHVDQAGADPISTTMGFNAAKITVDYWRNVYSLNYEVLKNADGSVPSVTEPSISQWIPTAPPPCQGIALNIQTLPERRRLLRRRNFWKAVSVRA